MVKLATKATTTKTATATKVKSAARRRTRALVREYRAAWVAIQAIGQAGVAELVAKQNVAYAKRITHLSRTREAWSTEQSRCFRVKGRQATGGAA